MSRTQKQIVLDLLIQRGESGVSAREAIYDLHITRLAAIIFDLRQEGYAIRATQKKGETAQYVLVKPTPKKEWRRCICGHPYRQHVSGGRCMFYEVDADNFHKAPVECQCQRFTEGEV